MTYLAKKTKLNQKNQPIQTSPIPILGLCCFLLLTACSVKAPTSNPIPAEQIDINLDVTKQSAEDAILPAMEVYSYFELFPLTLNRDVSSKDGTRFRVKDESLDTFDELRRYLEMYFTEELAQTLITNGMYEDEGGYLYATGKGRHKDEDIEEVTYHTLEMSDTQITYEVVVSYWSDAKMPENPKTLYFIREQIGGRWVFTVFPFFW